MVAFSEHPWLTKQVSHGLFLFSEVDCGVPPEGTNTIAVVATGVRFGDKFSYACNTNYETGSALVTECMANGEWSNPAPVCTRE